MMKKIKISALVLSIVLIVLSFASCGKQKDDYFKEYPTDGDSNEIETIEIKKNPTATLTLSDNSKVEIELYYYTAPNTVADFISLAKAKVYEGMVFDKVKVNGLVMLSKADGSVDQDYFIRNETHDTSSDNSLSHEKGVISMVKSLDNGHSTSQFFVCTSDNKEGYKYLDGRFTAFGKITSGIEAFEKIANGELVSSDSSGILDTVKEPLSIKSVSVKTYGANFPAPVIIQNDKEDTSK